MNATQRKIYAGLLWIELEKKYATGWARKNFQERYGFYPGWEPVEPQKPSATLEAQVKKKLRAYAKARRRAERRQELKAGAPRKASYRDMSSHNHMRAILREGESI